MGKHLVEKASESLTGVMDHAGEFVLHVAENTPGEYQRLLARDSVRQLLAGDNAFNPGKLYAYAEFRVFRLEFTSRFPDATSRACINAFCKLFLKNDISMSNLVAFLETDGSREVRLLQGRRAKKTGRV